MYGDFSKDVRCVRNILWKILTKTVLKNKFDDRI